MFVQAEELRKAILRAIDEKLGRKCGTSRDQLRAAVETIKYEDWAIEFDLVRDLSLYLFHLKKNFRNYSISTVQKCTSAIIYTFFSLVDFAIFLAAS